MIRKTTGQGRCSRQTVDFRDLDSRSKPRDSNGEASNPNKWCSWGEGKFIKRAGAEEVARMSSVDGEAWRSHGGLAKRCVLMLAVFVNLVREVKAGDACATLGLRRQMDDREMLLAVTPIPKEV